MADSDKKGPMMLQHGRGTRGLGRVGLCSAFVSSILVLAGSASATAHEIGPMSQDQNGRFTVQLGPQEVPEGGDPNGQGSADLNLSEQGKQACFSINWKGLKGEVTALHLHVAAAGSEGPHWIDFFNDQHFPGADGKASGCVPTTQDKIHAVITNPAGYYLNLHSSAFPPGALRGQLR
jgi:CHRD domain-containing protein